MKEVYKTIKNCRMCGSSSITKYLDLGEMPLANSLIEPKNANKKSKVFPLQVLYCGNCSLSQLSIVVNPKVLYSHYVYQSSISKTFQEHCSKMAEKVIELVGNPYNKLVVDIASNDGCLLQQFKNKGFDTIGVEPADNIAKIANSNGIKTICDFWSTDIAKKIARNYRKAKIITATNVFAHVDNLNSFLTAINLLLDIDGIFIIEVPYLYDLLQKNEFDTIYHEHLSYFLIRPLKKLYDQNNLKIFKIEKYRIHGGSIRIYASRSFFKENKSVQKFLKFEKENCLYNLKTYQNFEIKVKKIKNYLLQLLQGLKNKNKKIAAYGASAKGNTLLNYCGIDDKLVSFIVDDTPEKQNHLAPGSRIKIVDSSWLNKESPDYILLLAWNFASEIMHKTSRIYKKNVRYIVPIPKVRVI